MPTPKRPYKEPKKRPPGRPKTSPLSPIEQRRERQRRYRDNKRDKGRVAVELWIKTTWRDAILKSGQSLQDAADEAFAAYMAKRRGKCR